MLQHAVARTVAVFVVDRLEFVQVGKQHHEFLLIALDALEHGLGNILQSAPVEQPGERIETAVQFQLVATAFDAAHEDVGVDQNDAPEQIQEQQSGRELRAAV